MDRVVTSSPLSDVTASERTRMAKRFSERILGILQKPGYTPMKARKLARSLGIAEAEYGDFHDAVDALRRVGRVVLGTNNAIMLPYPPGQVVGTYRSNPRGFGFVVPDGPTAHGDLYIPRGNSLDAVTGDKVLCHILKRGVRGGKKLFGGRILRVIERGHSQFVGQLCREGKVWFVEPDGNMLHAPILIGDPKAKSARAGDQVVVEITQYPSEGSPAKGVIVERLGKRGRPGVDLLSVIRQYHLSDQFPKNVLKEARHAVRTFKPDAAAAQREDLSNHLIITIDPDDARDFDDAISLVPVESPSSATRKPRKKGQKRKDSKTGHAVWELGVHIADVSAFAAVGSALDEEAQKRGTSVYFPGHVLPMLPEVLSNGVCSLQEGEPRLCKSAFICYDAKGRVVSARFANTVIRSAKRLTYRQAQAILDGKKGRFSKAVVELIQRMDTLARAIRERRFKNGMIVLDLPAIDLILDDHGNVVDAEPEDTSFTHTIIEMFMVEANEAVARLLSSLKLPFLRRIHPDPDEDSLEAMARFVQAGGERLPNKVTPHDLQKLLKKLRGKSKGYAVNLAVLKSMQMAEYSPKAVGHFALASDNYAHFTSPIRRYPDLMVHRLLDLHLQGKIKSKAGRKGRQPTGVISLEELHECGRQMSYLSRRAESAENELKTLKVLTLLQQHVGDTFEGVITGVTNFGLFVQHPKYLIDGLLRLEDLGDDWWDVDVQQGRVTGERSCDTFALGNSVKVLITDVDLCARQLKLGLSEGTKVRRRPRKKPATSRNGQRRKRYRSSSAEKPRRRKTGKRPHRKGRKR
ncbi:MAG: ribonuclease R [Phycisphaerales bacterium]|nr:ribonuclease R [Phycisphaerales bacterium]